MVNQPQPASPKFILDKLIAVCLIAWLLFGGGMSAVKTWLTPARIGQVAQALDTIKTGAGRVTSGAPRAASAPNTGRLGDQWSSVITPPPAQSQAQIEARADAEYQAAVDAGNIASAGAAQVALPTAVVTIPTVPPVEQIRVVPDPGKPVVYAQTEPIGPTPIPTLVYPTPLPAAAAAYELSPDGLCVIAPRGGARYQVCQAWKYQPSEAASVADYIRTGMLPGVAVP